MLVPTAPGFGAASAATGLGTGQDLGDKQIFLKLLVAQMENQDPLNPTDATQMSSQLAQFNMVEQQTDTNKWLEQIAGGQGLGGSSSAGGSDASYLGKTVTLNNSTLAFDGANTNLFDVNLNGNSSQTYVVVRSGDGTAVRTIQMGALNTGTYGVQWNGTDDTGQKVPIGNYTVEVGASDNLGNNVPAIVQRTGIIDAIRYTGTGTQFMVGGVPASLDDISEIRL